MNIPTKVLRSTFITYETYFHHQQLAKRFYKSTRSNKKNTKSNLTGEFGVKNLNEVENISYTISDIKQNFKEELLKW